MGKPDAVGTQATAPTPRPEVRAAPALAIDHGRGHAPVRSVIEEILPAAGPQAALPPQAAALVAPTPHGIGATSDKIGARVGTPGWDNQLGQKIVWMVAGKEQSATLTLNPPDMGPMQVVLSVNNDQASVTFTAAQPEVRQALENAMPKLREMMGESGISLANANVTEGSAGQRQAASEQGQPRHAGGRGGAEPNTGATDAEARAGARPVRVGELRGLVDTFA